MSDSTAVARSGLGRGAWAAAALGFLCYCPLLLGGLISGGLSALGPVALLSFPGLVAMLLLVWLHRAPIAVVLSLAGLWLLSPLVLGPALAAQAHVARHHRVRDAITVACLLMTGKVAGIVTLFRDFTSWFQADLFISVTGLVIALLLGRLLRSTTDANQQRAAAQAARQDAWEAQLNEARLVERERIAREMHDVVAHRISLIALHAGALAHHMRSENGEAGDLARAIQANAQSSLDELRTMLAHLRGSTAPPEPPQPTLLELGTLLADARSAGQHVTVEVDENPAAVPTGVSRHAYRIVQEGLTNARKHAPGAPVALSLRSTDDRLRVVVRNRLAASAPPNRSGSGLGLVGIAERIDLVGGNLSHGIVGGEFILDATLPHAPGGAV